MRLDREPPALILVAIIDRQRNGLGRLHRDRYDSVGGVLDLDAPNARHQADITLEFHGHYVVAPCCVDRLGFRIGFSPVELSGLGGGKPGSLGLWINK